MFVQGGRQECCRWIQILCSPQIPFMQWNTGWQNNWSPDVFFFAIHFINKCFANQNVCKRTEDHKWTMQTFCHFDVIVAQKKMFASNVCLPWPPLLSRMLLAQRNVYELVRISGQQPNIKQGRSLCRHQMRPRNAPSEDNKTFFLKWNVCKHFCIAPVLPNKMGGRGPIWISN